MTDGTPVKLSIPFIVSALALALAAFVLAVRMFFRPLPLPPLPEPDPCTEAARETDTGNGGYSDDDLDLDTPPETTVTNVPPAEPRPAAIATLPAADSSQLITIGWALFTPSEVKRMEAMRERLQAGAA